jgi:hypothetical protein
MAEVENFCAVLESPELVCAISKPALRRRAQATTMGEMNETAARV